MICIFTWEKKKMLAWAISKHIRSLSHFILNAMSSILFTTPECFIILSFIQLVLLEDMKSKVWCIAVWQWQQRCEWNWKKTHARMDAKNNHSVFGNIGWNYVNSSRETNAKYNLLGAVPMFFCYFSTLFFLILILCSYCSFVCPNGSGFVCVLVVVFWIE